MSNERQLERERSKCSSAQTQENDSAWQSRFRMNSKAVETEDDRLRDIKKGLFGKSTLELDGLSHHQTGENQREEFYFSSGANASHENVRRYYLLSTLRFPACHSTSRQDVN